MNVWKIALAMVTLLALGCQQLPHQRDITAQAKRHFDAGHYHDARRTLLELSDKRDREVQYMLGYLYFYGQGGSSDRQQARHWFERAASDGHVLAKRAIQMIDAYEQEVIDSQQIEKEKLDEAPHTMEQVVAAQMANWRKQKKKVVNLRKIHRNQPSALPMRKQGASGQQQRLKQAGKPQPAKPSGHKYDASEESQPVAMVSHGQTRTSSAKFESAHHATAESLFEEANAVVMAAPKDTYAVQLIGLGSKERMLAFIAQHQGMLNLQYVKTRRSGQPWYVLYLGPFRRIEDAKTALKTLPKSLVMASPFVASYGSLQSQLSAA